MRDRRTRGGSSCWCPGGAAVPGVRRAVHHRPVPRGSGADRCTARAGRTLAVTGLLKRLPGASGRPWWRRRLAPDPHDFRAPPLPCASSAGHVLSAPWTPAQPACFTGYAMWACLTEPWSLAFPGVRTEEVGPWVEDGETWQSIRSLLALRRVPRHRLHAAAALGPRATGRAVRPAGPDDGRAELHLLAAAPGGGGSNSSHSSSVIADAVGVGVPGSSPRHLRKNPLASDSAASSASETPSNSSR